MISTEGFIGRIENSYLRGAAWVDRNFQKFDQWIDSRSQKNKGILQRQIDVYERQADWFNAATVVLITSLCLCLFGGGSVVSLLSVFSSAVSYVGRIKIGQLMDHRWKILEPQLKGGLRIVKDKTGWDVSLRNHPTVPNIEVLSITIFKHPSIAVWSEPYDVDDEILKARKKYG